MQHTPTILSITGSDNIGATGIQADIRTITALGGRALTAITAVTTLEPDGSCRICDLTCEQIVGQVRAVAQALRPQVIKVGMLRDAATIWQIRDEIIGCKHRVMVPGVMTSQGTLLLDDAAISAWRAALLPEASLLIVRGNEAERLLGCDIVTPDDMTCAAQAFINMGCEAVMIRGSRHDDERITSLVCADGHQQFVSSANPRGWLQHGVSGALSSAIATRLGWGDGIDDAIRHAHAYMHSQVVYAVEPTVQSHRPADLYNRLMSLIVTHHCEAHDVAYYADLLAVSPRYLSMVTQKTVMKSPKQIIDEVLMREASSLLATTLLSVGQVAYKLGFPSPARFSTFFAAHQGVSPVQYRQQLGTV
jgi:hydroxymethylpyrimidine/phosphomethylpyrimidine kinase